MVPVSSASPRALERYAGRGLDMASEMRSAEAMLRAALGRFRESCHEYAVDTEGLAEGLGRLAGMGESLDLWVRRVGRDFERADQSRRPWWRRLLDLFPRIELPSWFRITLPRLQLRWFSDAASIPPWLMTAVSGVLGVRSWQRSFSDRLSAALGLPRLIIVLPWPPRSWRPPFWWWWDRRFRVMRQVPRFLAGIVESILRIAARFGTTFSPVQGPVVRETVLHAPVEVSTPEQEANGQDELQQGQPEKTILSQKKPVARNDSDLDQEILLKGERRSIRWLIQKWGCLMTCLLMLRNDNGEKVDIYDVFCEFYKSANKGRLLSDDIKDSDPNTPSIDNMNWPGTSREHWTYAKGDTDTILKEQLEQHAPIVVNIGTGIDGHWVIVDGRRTDERGQVLYTIRDPLSGTSSERPANSLRLWERPDGKESGNNIVYLDANPD